MSLIPFLEQASLTTLNCSGAVWLERTSSSRSDSLIGVRQLKRAVSTPFRMMVIGNQMVFDFFAHSYIAEDIQPRLQRLFLPGENAVADHDHRYPEKSGEGQQALVPMMGMNHIDVARRGIEVVCDGDRRLAQPVRGLPEHGAVADDLVPLPLQFEGQGIDEHLRAEKIAERCIG